MYIVYECWDEKTYCDPLCINIYEYKQHILYTQCTINSAVKKFTRSSTAVLTSANRVVEYLRPWCLNFESRNGFVCRMPIVHLFIYNEYLRTSAV